MKSLLKIAAAISIVLSPTAPAAEVKQVGKGDTIPDVSVRTAEGKRLSLREIAKAKPTVIMFYRGGWCPFCNRHLMAVAEVEKDLTGAGFQILAISADQPSKLSETPDREKLPYILLSDSTMKTAGVFGITFKVPDELVKTYRDKHGIDLEAASGETHHLLPHPAVFIVDPSGVIQFAHVNPDYKTRLKPSEILAAANAVRAAPSR